MIPTMLKAIVLLSFCVIVALAQNTYYLSIYSNTGARKGFYIYEGYRKCACLKNTQTNKIENEDGGDVKLFSTSDCTGNYVQMKNGATQSNAQWVNSMSYGSSGMSSDGPYRCPNYYAE
ncbi:hypothetical protein BGZ68_001876 [Mortierella alpina]|nr:hypothetical protein BGZ68_001876 [Mortierella alpina]